MTDVIDDVQGLQEMERLAELESIIQKNKTQFYEFGCALLEISDSKLYKFKNGGKHRTFEDYCKSVWGLSRPRAYQLIDSANAVDNLSAVVDKDELNERMVRPLAKLKDPDLQVAAFQEAQRHADVEGGRLTARHVEIAAERVREEAADRFSPIIKPTDAWNFSSIVYGRLAIDETDANGQERHGYIPGEIYANALWYYTKPGNVVVAPMAGSGQIWRVWEDRGFWMRPEPWDLYIHTFDLNPRGPYKDRIGQWDMTQGFPMDHADYVFMDIPYYGMVDGQYSDRHDDLANMDLAAWSSSIQQIARSCAAGQREGGLCSIVSPNWRDTDKSEIVMTTLVVCQAFLAAGYDLYDKAYSSRRVQQAQGPRAAVLNNSAKENRTMLTDISEIMTFKRKG